MLFQFNIYSSLLLIFVVHILVYAIMLWRRGMMQDSSSDKLLGSFLLVAAFTVVPWMVGFAGWYDDKTGHYRDILFYTPFVNGLLIGPLLYLYVKTITNYSYRLSRKDWLHFIPGALYLLWSLLVVIVDQVILGRYYLMSEYADPDFDGWYQLLQKTSIIIYLVLSVAYYRQYRRYTQSELSFAEQASLLWLRNFLIAFGLITVLPFIQDILELFPFFKNLFYKGAWYYFFSLALVVYYIAITGYNANSIPLRRLLFEPQVLLQYKAPLLLESPYLTEDASFEVIGEGKNEDQALKQWKEKLSHYVLFNKAYENPELTLSVLARELSTNTSVLSKVINQGFGQSFNDYINQLRVEAVIEKLKAGEQQRQTLLGIAFDAGFNSKATFNRAFKKSTGLNPRDWLLKHIV